MALYRCMSGSGGGDGSITVGVEKKVGTITIGNTTYDRYVKVVDCGAFPSTATSLSVALGETYVGVLSLEGMIGGASGYELPLPYIESNGSIALYFQSGNIIATPSKTYSGYTQTLVTVEYYR